MTLTELKYIIAVAYHKHFGHAAKACHVAQPTLSIGIKKLEDELGITLFERGGSEITITPLGEKIVLQAKRVLEESATLKEIARQSQNPLLGPFRLGVIYTIGPYLLPSLVNSMIQRFPTMPLILQENFTARLLDLLRQGELDAAILSLPLQSHNLKVQALYDEPLIVAIPKHHPWRDRPNVSTQDLQSETMLLLGNGHCFRDQVLEICPEIMLPPQTEHNLTQTFEGSSLETIRHMVASGIGITVLPMTAVSHLNPKDTLLDFVPFKKPAPSRRVVIAWRKSFTRIAAIDALREAIFSCSLNGITPLPHALPEG